MLKKISLWLGLVFACVVAVAQPVDNLLPKPQQMVDASGTFTLGKVMLDASVLASEWAGFVQEAGGSSQYIAQTHLIV